MKTISKSKSPSLLIVDDERAIRLLLNEFLQRRFRITTLNGGLECLQYLGEKGEPDVLIVDLKMPDMSGLDIIKKIRQNPAWDQLAIIVLSAEESSKERISCLRAGADDYIVKPFNPQELDARIDAILRRVA